MTAIAIFLGLCVIGLRVSRAGRDIAHAINNLAGAVREQSSDDYERGIEP